MTNLFALVLKAFDILASLAVDSPFCLFSIVGVGVELVVVELVLLVRDPEEVEAEEPLLVASLFVGATRVAEAGEAVTAEEDDAELTSVAVAVRARLWPRSRSRRSSLMLLLFVAEDEEDEEDEEVVRAADVKAWC